MIDESFHLTPLDVRRTEFPAALRGYDKARVDEFRERVANELERLTRLNQDLDAKAKGFHEQLRAFRERDKALNEALVSAQQLRAEVRMQAEREAELLRREARAEGERVIDGARADMRRLAGEIEALERSRRAYLAQLRAMVARQLAELEAIPEVLAPRPEPSLRDAGAGAGPDGAGASSAPATSPAPARPPDPSPDEAAASGPVRAEARTVLPPAPAPPVLPPTGTPDGTRHPAPTPAWLKTVPAE